MPSSEGARRLIALAAIVVSVGVKDYATRPSTNDPGTQSFGVRLLTSELSVPNEARLDPTWTPERMELPAPRLELRITERSQRWSDLG